MPTGISCSLASQGAVPSVVSRAIRFMQSNLTARVSMTEISAASGVPQRTLRRQFKRFTGQSPLAFYRNLRLDAAHRILKSRDNADVTSVATEYGFIHFGQFAARYRQRFRELPSETRRTGRARFARLLVAAPHDAVTLAVTPFAGGTGVGQVALAGSMTDAAISALGKTRWLEIVHGDRSAIPTRARYALLGRIEVYGSHVQVIVRLAEAGSGRHLWGNTFDGSLSEAPKSWQQAIDGIAATVPVRVRAAEVARIDRKPPHERTVNDLVTRALSYSHKLTAEANSRAFEDIDKALSLDPEHTLAAALGSWGRAQRAIYNFGGVLRAEREEAQRLASVALALDNEDPQVLAILGTSLTMIGDLDAAEMLINRCLAIDPYCAMAWQRRGWIAIYRGAGTALADFRRCLSLGGAHDLDRHNILFGISTAHFLAGRYDRAADWAVRGIQQQPSAIWAYRIAAPAQALCGRMGEARKSAAVLLRHYPELTASAVVASLPMQPEFLARHAEGLEAAGLPI